MAKKPEGTFLTSCGAGTCSPAPVFYRAAVREKNVAALTIFRAPSPNAHTNVAALIERHAGQQVTGGLDDRVMPPNLSLRGGRRPTWQSREGSYVFADGFPVIRHCPARFPRRFAPRNDTSGWCSGTPVPLYSLISLHKALTTRKGHAASVRRQSRQRLRSDRRYTPYFGIFRFNDGWYGATVPSRDCHGPFGASQ